MALLKGEVLHGFANVYAPLSLYPSVFNSHWSLLLVVLILAVIFLVKPFVSYSLLVNERSHQDLYVYDLIAHLFFPLFAATFLDNGSVVAVLDMFGLLLVVTGTLFFQLSVDEENTPNADTEAHSVIQSVKAQFWYETPRELEALDIKLHSIYQLLGLQGLYRVAFDTVLARNKRQVMHTSNPMLQLRDQFDVYFKSRSALWGGTYPRPSVEMVEKEWKLSKC